MVRSGALTAVSSDRKPLGDADGVVLGELLKANQSVTRLDLGGSACSAEALPGEAPSKKPRCDTMCCSQFESSTVPLTKAEHDALFDSNAQGGNVAKQICLQGSSTNSIGRVLDGFLSEFKLKLKREAAIAAERKAREKDANAS